MKRKLLILSVLAICIATLAAGSLAYFNTEQKARNVITSGNIDIALQEWADKEKTEPFPENGVSGVMPGSEVTKIVEVKNTGSSDAWVRVKVTKDISLAEGVEAQVDLGLLKLDCDKGYWTEKDGYYYYHEALKPGETTKALFAAVTFDSTMGNEYQNATATVDVLAQAVQTANNGESVMEAQGWPEAE